MSSQQFVSTPVLRELTDLMPSACASTCSASVSITAVAAAAPAVAVAVALLPVVVTEPRLSCAALMAAAPTMVPPPSASLEQLMPIDTKVDGERYLYTAELPGACIEDIDVDIAGGTLILSAGPRSAAAFASGTPVSARLTRRISMPSDSAPHLATASFCAGALRVVLPKIKPDGHSFAIPQVQACNRHLKLMRSPITIRILF